MNIKKIASIAILASATFFASNSQCFQIFIKKLDGKTITLELNPTDTIADIKQQIQNSEGIPIETQSIIVAGRLLPDDMTMTTLQPQNLETIHLVVRPGGQAGAPQAQPMPEQPALEPNREARYREHVRAEQERQAALQAAGQAGQAYAVGAPVRVTVKGEPKIGVIRNFNAELNMYIVDTGDKERSFSAGEVNPF